MEFITRENIALIADITGTICAIGLIYISLKYDKKERIDGYEYCKDDSSDDSSDDLSDDSSDGSSDDSDNESIELEILDTDHEVS